MSAPPLRTGSFPPPWVSPLQRARDALVLSAVKFNQLAHRCGRCGGTGKTQVEAWHVHPVFDQRGRADPFVHPRVHAVIFADRDCLECLEIRQLERLCRGITL